MSTISRAIIDGNKLNFDFEDNQDLYGGIAKCFIYKDDKVLGKAHYQDEAFTENIEGFNFYNTAGCMIYGKGFTEQQPVSFIADLKYVKSFPDEKSAKAVTSKKAYRTKKAGDLKK